MTDSTKTQYQINTSNNNNDETGKIIKFCFKCMDIKVGGEFTNTEQSNLEVPKFVKL